MNLSDQLLAIHSAHIECRARFTQANDNTIYSFHFGSSERKDVVRVSVCLPGKSWVDFEVTADTVYVSRDYKPVVLDVNTYTEDEVEARTALINYLQTEVTEVTETKE